MNADQLIHYIKHPELLDQDSLYQLRNLIERYPYFQTARMLYLKNLYLLHHEQFGPELRRAALYVSDRRQLFYFIEGIRLGEEAVLQQETPSDNLEPDAPPTYTLDESDQPTVSRTLELIESFLHEQPLPHDDITDMSYATDYTTYLLQQVEEEEAKHPNQEDETTEDDRSSELIDGFLSRADDAPLLPVSSEEEPVGPNTSEDEKPLDESYFTETLAQIYIKQGRYDRAIEIIQRLSLKYPEKNVYFADRIAYIEQLKEKNNP